MKSKFKNYNLLRSFYCAFCGVIHALGQERNLRIHFAAAAYILYFSRYFSLDKAEFALLILSIGLVIACEMLNTAIEATVNVKTDTYNAFAKIAKDTAAGAVLLASAVSVAVGVLLLWQPQTFPMIWQDILKAPVVWLFLLALTVYWVIWPHSHDKRR